MEAAKPAVWDQEQGARELVRGPEELEVRTAAREAAAGSAPPFVTCCAQGGATAKSMVTRVGGCGGCVRDGVARQRQDGGGGGMGSCGGGGCGGRGGVTAAAVPAAAMAVHGGKDGTVAPGLRRLREVWWR